MKPSILDCWPVSSTTISSGPISTIFARKISTMFLISARAALPACTLMSTSSLAMDSSRVILTILITSISLPNWLMTWFSSFSSSTVTTILMRVTSGSSV